MLNQQELPCEGYEVITVTDCDGFLQMIVRDRPDAIIAAVKTGEVSEFSSLKEIRDANYDMPVILSTAYLPLSTFENLMEIARSMGPKNWPISVKEGRNKRKGLGASKALAVITMRNTCYHRCDLAEEAPNAVQIPPQEASGILLRHL